MSYGFKPHDVRKLRICATCDGVGHLDRMLTLRSVGNNDSVKALRWKESGRSEDS